jgi:hypothetical protein
MATLMAVNHQNQKSNYTKKYSGSKGTGNAASQGRPSDVLISCFKINDLEIDENKV